MFFRTSWYFLMLSAVSLLCLVFLIFSWDLPLFPWTLHCYHYIPKFLIFAHFFWYSLLLRLVLCYIIVLSGMLDFIIVSLHSLVFPYFPKMFSFPPLVFLCFLWSLFLVIIFITEYFLVIRPVFHSSFRFPLYFLVLSNISFSKNRPLADSFKILTKLYRSHYPHRSRDSLSPVCVIFSILSSTPWNFLGFSCIFWYLRVLPGIL